MTPPFRIATRDELWLRGRLVESRLSHGEAIEDERGILATDARDESLVAICDRELERLREVMPRDARARLVVHASTEETTSTMTIGRRGLSVVTSPEHAREDDELLRTIAGVEPSSEAIDYRGISMIWRHGSAAVLLHEAIGHAKEHEHVPIEWPAWLKVDVPLRSRRETFRDVPLLRMTALVANHHDAPRAECEIEILLVAGGSYEPLTESITLRIAAADYDGRRLPPFEIHESREAVARALIGAEGETLRYPGVVCSREGQELVVGSYAPVMMTCFR